MPTAASETAGRSAVWQQIVRDRLPLFGHRNVIAVVDSAYPAQSRPGVETVVTGALQIEVARTVLAEVGKARHVRPRIFLDRELEYVIEADAPGISRYREELRTLLGDTPVQAQPHEQIIAMLDKAAQLFNVLILKTDLVLPYTSVFVQLECGYWTDAAEQRLRGTMPSSQP
jgi:hypothetical protein